MAGLEIDPKKDYLIVIDEQVGVDGTDTVFVSVNGHAYQIARGYEVVVPGTVVKVLEDAVYTKYKYQEDGSIKEYKVPRINFRILREATAKDKAKNKIKIAK